MIQGAPVGRERVAVLGAGRTGMAALRHLTARGNAVLLSDAQPIPNDVKVELASLGIPWEECGHSERVLSVDAVVPSPGIPVNAPILQRARACGIPVIGELELAYRECPSKRIIAVTGTVGKTTTTHLIANLLGQRGHSVVTAGNIGVPFTEALASIDSHTVIVLEVSSFQLEHVDTFCPTVGVLTRFAPHHLDRHGTTERYFQAKARLFRHQHEGDAAIVHHQAPSLPWGRAACERFAAHDVGEIRWPFHQRENLAAAMAAARRLDPHVSLPGSALGPAIELPHRLETVATLAGTRFVNDAKSTTPTATAAALQAFPDESVALVLGGRSQGEDLQELTDEIAQRRPEVVYLMGDARQRWMRRLRSIGCRHIRPIASLDQLMRSVGRYRPDVCLFSPGAASFDQFNSYATRGDAFRTAVAMHAQTQVTAWGDQVGPTLERRSF
ncbi:MAG: Mur ligase family protein [Candidatus Bipolaricaulia bacterium]